MMDLRHQSDPADVTAARCIACAHVLPHDARFCPQCGQEVHSVHDERRIVTVLFADLVGFTRLAEHRDPEQVKRFIDSCFEVLVGDIEHYGGRVDKILGDGVLALFGAPISHEDDAERAVRCALQMHRSLAEVVEAGVLADAPADGQLMRIGVNTGEVLVGSLAGTDYTAMGDVVNTAARLQTEAPPGRVLVGDSTRALTHQAIAYERGDVVVPRGREQTETTWLAIAPTAPPGARHRLSDTPLVGRALELEAVAATQALSIARGRGVLVTIAAEAGVGKTRLLHELGRQFVDRHGGRVLHGTCVPYGEANPWWPIAMVLEQALGLGGHGRGPRPDLAAIAAERLAAIDPDSDVRHSVVDMVCHLLGAPSDLDRLDSPPVRSAIHQPLGRLLHALAADQPTVITIDDLHWASNQVIEALDYIADLLPHLPIALIVAQRPHGDTGWWPDDRVTNLAFELEPLGKAETFEMVASLLPDHASDLELLTTIFDRSGGNPLFVHELAALARTGVEVPVLPDTLRTIIGARLDQLARDDRNVIDNAATLGTSGTLDALAAFGERLGQPVIGGALERLEERGLLATDGGRWRFLSDSVRDAAYATMSKTSRAQRHATLAEVLGEAAQPSLDDLAHHTAAAAQLLSELGSVPGVSPLIAEDALRLLYNAARRAALRGSFRIAIAQASRGLELLPQHPSLHTVRTDLLLIRAASNLELRQFKAAWADVDDVLIAVPADRDGPRRGEALRLLGGLHHAMGAQEAARDALTESARLLRASNRADLLARALRSRGFIELFNGSLVDAETYLAQADAIYESLDDTSGRAWIEQHRALAAFLRGDLDDAAQRLSVVAATMDRLGDLNGVGWAQGMSAFVAFYQSDFDRADALACAVAERAAERGDEWAMAMMRTLRAHVSRWRGNLTEALEGAKAARTAFRRIGDPLGLTQALSVLVRVQVALGQFDDARRSGNEIMSVAETSPLGSIPVIAVAGAAMHRGLAHHALRRVITAEDAMVVSQISNDEPALIRALATAQLADFDDAARVLAALGPRGSATPMARAVGAVVDVGLGHADRALAAADTVRADPRSSYFDRALAELAAVSALAQTGHHAEAVSCAHQARERVRHVGDVIATDLFLLIARRLDGESLDEQADTPASGWIPMLNALAVTPAGVRRSR